MISRRRSLFAGFVLLLWCAFLFGYGIDAGALYRTESLRAIIGREALHGNWLVPTLCGEPFLTKPPGMYVAIGAAGIPFGEVTTVSARIPSVVAATVTVFLFLAIFCRVTDRKSALFGAMLMPVSFLWLEKAPSAEIDMLQLAWVSGGVLCFLRAVEPGPATRTGEQHDPSPRTTHSFCWWIIALLCVAGGFLTKWTAPAFFYLTVGTFLWWRGQLRLLFGWRHLSAAAIASGLCGLWAISVAQQVGWQTLFDTVLAEGSQRFGPRHARAYPWLESLTYPFQILIANAPWSVLAIYALRPSFVKQWNSAGQRLLLLFHCWAWPNLLFWSLPAQHHVRYSLPMCPGIVGLGVMVLLGWIKNATERGISSSRINGVIAAILLAWCVVKIVYVETVIPRRTHESHLMATVDRLHALVPEHETLHLCKLKDEGVLFYHGRPARRFQWDRPPEPGSYALLIATEWEQHARAHAIEALAWLRDQQGDAIVLVRFPERASPR